MDLSIIMPWITAALAIIALLGHAKSFFGSEAKQAAAEIGVLKETVDSQARRLQSVENDISHLPDRDSWHRLELSMTRLSGRLDTMDERLTQVAAISERMQELLLEQAKK